MGNNNLISSKKTYYISIAILAGMFFIFGFVSVSYTHLSGYVQQHTNRSEKQTNFYLYKENIPNFQQTEISFGKLKYAFSVHLYISS